MLVFEWDVRKAGANLRKHQVGFEEAASVFGDPLARIFSDDAHSASEAREIIVGALAFLATMPSTRPDSL